MMTGAVRLANQLGISKSIYSVARQMSPLIFHSLPESDSILLSQGDLSPLP